MATDLQIESFRDDFMDNDYLGGEATFTQDYSPLNPHSARLLIHSHPESNFPSDVRVAHNPVSFRPATFSPMLPMAFSQVSSPESQMSQSLSLPLAGRTSLVAALTMPEPMFSVLADKKHSFLHRSLPNLAEACTAAIHSDSPLSVPAKCGEDCNSTVDCEMDSICLSRDCTDPADRAKPLARKEFTPSESDSDASSTSSILTAGRKKAQRRFTTFKRIKTSDANAFPMDADEEASVSSAAELERFFDSMGLEDQQGFSTGRSASGTLHLQVSDDAIESEEDQLESVSIIGLNSGIQPLVETDDDEPELVSETPVPTAAPKIQVNRHTETISLRNARICKWLVGCRGDVHK